MSLVRRALRINSPTRGDVTWAQTLSAWLALAVLGVFVVACFASAVDTIAAGHVPWAVIVAVVLWSIAAAIDAHARAVRARRWRIVEGLRRHRYSAMPVKSGIVVLHHTTCPCATRSETEHGTLLVGEREIDHWLNTSEKH